MKNPRKKNKIGECNERRPAPIDIELPDPEEGAEADVIRAPHVELQRE